MLYTKLLYCPVLESLVSPLLCTLQPQLKSRLLSGPLYHSCNLIYVYLGVYGSSFYQFHLECLPVMSVVMYHLDVNRWNKWKIKYVISGLNQKYNMARRGSVFEIPDRREVHVFGSSMTVCALEAQNEDGQPKKYKKVLVVVFSFRFPWQTSGQLSW